MALAPFSVKRTLVLAKIESTYGEDPTPSPDTDALTIFDVTLTPQTNLIERDVHTDTKSNLSRVRGGTHVELSFKTELKGSGSLGVAPESGPLFRACSFEETIDGGVSVTYTPRSTGDESVTFYVYMDKLRFILTGCVGNVEIDLSAGSIGMLSWTFKGLYNTPTDNAVPAAVVDTTKPPLVMASNSLRLSYEDPTGYFAPVIQQVTFDIGNTISMRENINADEGFEGFFIPARSVRGTMNPEMTLRADQDSWANWEDGVAESFRVTVGSVSGKIIIVRGPKLVLASLTPGDRETIRTLDTEFDMEFDGGDDELELVFQ